MGMMFVQRQFFFFFLVQSVSGNKKVLSEVVSIYISLSHLLPILSLSSTN